MLDLIFQSKRIIPKRAVDGVIGTLLSPEMTRLEENSWQELRNLTITQVQWDGVETIGFTINDSQDCKVGPDDFEATHTFDPSKKISKIVVIIDDPEFEIMQINFYHRKQIIVKLGWSDKKVKKRGKRREVFEIGDDEKLIGC